MEAVDDPEQLGDGEVEEVRRSWRWMLRRTSWGTVDGPIPADDLYERVKPFKDLVAEDIREGGDE